MFPRTSGPRRPALSRVAGTAAAAACLVMAASACSSAVSIENADVPAWRATALPTASGTVLEDAGKILNREPLVKDAADVPAGVYTLTMTCDGGGKAFFTVTAGSTKLAEAGAACNGSRERAKITVPAAGRVQVSTASVDAPLIYAYHLAAGS
jgi:proline racemase